MPREPESHDTGSSEKEAPWHRILSAGSSLQDPLCRILSAGSSLQSHTLGAHDGRCEGRITRDGGASFG